MKNFTTQQSILAAVIASLIGLPLLVYFAFLPALRNFQSLSQQVADKKTGVTALKTPREEPEVVEEKVKKLKEQIEALKGEVFWETDISRFLNQITQLASDLKINFVSLKPEAASSSSEKGKELPDDYLLTEVPISLTIKSNYDDLVEFIKRIEQSDKFIAIESLTIDTDRQDIYSHNVRIDLSIFMQGKR